MQDMIDTTENRQQSGGIKNSFLKWYLKFILFLIPILIIVHILYLLVISFVLFFAVFEPYMHEGSIIIPFSYIFVAIFSALWIYATHYISNKFRVAQQKFKPILTMICFFIPVINCIYPPIIMQKIWKVSDPDTTSESWKKAKNSKTMIANWFLFAILNIMMIIALLKDFYLSNFENKLFTFSFFGTLLTIIIFMFKLYSRQLSKVKKIGLLENNSIQQSYDIDHRESIKYIKEETNRKSPKTTEKNRKPDEYGGYGDYHNTY